MCGMDGWRNVRGSPLDNRIDTHALGLERQSAFIQIEDVYRYNGIEYRRIDKHL